MAPRAESARAACAEASAGSRWTPFPSTAIPATVSRSPSYASPAEATSPGPSAWRNASTDPARFHATLPGQSPFPSEGVSFPRSSSSRSFRKPSRRKSGTTREASIPRGVNPDAILPDREVPVDGDQAQGETRGVGALLDLLPPGPFQAAPGGRAPRRGNRTPGSARTPSSPRSRERPGRCRTDPPPARGGRPPSPGERRRPPRPAPPPRCAPSNRPAPSRASIRAGTCPCRRRR